MLVQAGLCRTCSATPKPGFLASRLKLYLHTYKNEFNAAVKLMYSLCRWVRSIKVLRIFHHRHLIGEAAWHFVHKPALPLFVVTLVVKVWIFELVQFWSIQLHVWMHVEEFQELSSSTFADTCKQRKDMNRLVGKPTMWFSNRSDTNLAVQAQKMAREWKFWI